MSARKSTAITPQEPHHAHGASYVAIHKDTLDELLASPQASLSDFVWDDANAPLITRLAKTLAEVTPEDLKNRFDSEEFQTADF